MALDFPNRLSRSTLSSKQLCLGQPPREFTRSQHVCVDKIMYTPQTLGFWRHFHIYCSLGRLLLLNYFWPQTITSSLICWWSHVALESHIFKYLLPVVPDKIVGPHLFYYLNFKHSTDWSASDSSHSKSSNVCSLLLTVHNGSTTLKV